MNSANASPLTITPQTSSTISDACYADQRYKNYRVQTFRYINLLSTFSWSRQDSYYESTATAYTNTGSPGVVLDMSLAYNLAANRATYVFPTYNEKDGIQINHFGTAGTNIDPTTYSTAGTGLNNLTTAASTYDSTNFCPGSNLLLEGTDAATGTSGLSTTVAAYSDGYKATSTLNLETFMAGTTAGWKGYCIIHYRTEYVMDASNGTVCHVATQSATSIYDLADQYLMHIPNTTWSPPKFSAAVAPTDFDLTLEKYGVAYTPSTATSDIYFFGHFITVDWYQPKYASFYADLPRYGSGYEAGAFCMYGTGSTSYFIASANSN